MDDKKCCICLDHIYDEEPAILTIGRYVNAKYLCENCAKLIETAQRGKDYNEIKDSLDKLSKKIDDANIDDVETIDTVTEILETSAKRAKEIKEGTYDFALDDVEVEDENLIDEIPEDMRETEEDRLLDEKEAEEKKKWDKITSIIFGVVLACCVAYLLYVFFK